MSELLLSPEDEWILNDFIVYKDSGYWRIKKTWSSSYQYLHRFITSAEKGDIIDHINRNKNDNRRDNLRKASRSLNNYNRKVDNPLGRGIYFDKSGNRYRACISLKGRTLKLGSYRSINDAKLAYNKKAVEIYGKDAYQHEVISDQTFQDLPHFELI